VNYDLPENPADYVHRIGRTGRAQKTGHAISFAMPDQKRDVKDIERLIKKQLPVSNTPKELKSVD
jgi:ATP-dependent RNA helicase RhlE